MERPDWLKSSVAAADLDRIESSVREFERRCALEIVPLIVRRSTPIGHVGVILTLTLALVGTLVLWDLQDMFPDGWLLPSLGLWFLASVAISIPLARLEILQRWLTAREDEIVSVDHRARYEFNELRVGRQTRRTGVLVMVSLMEHRIVWLPDRAASEALPEGLWGELAETMSAGLRRGDWVGAFQKALGRLEEAAAKALPPAANHGDELGNALQIRE